jgi:hypothetical protein
LGGIKQNYWRAQLVIKTKQFSIHQGECLAVLTMFSKRQWTWQAASQLTKSTAALALQTGPVAGSNQHSLILYKTT